MISLGHMLALGAVMFCISVAGIFLNRKNIIVLLMSVELMLLSVNINFVAFSRQLGDGLAILVTLFRTRHTINVGEVDSLKG
ncbi:MAG: NADH-quinone oxidoreductase subunit K [Stenotrophomonas nitritireducens]|nr:NADH-quinone oxidoreductase subunit K [Stenotrophomonas nitritireducens]